MAGTKRIALGLAAAPLLAVALAAPAEAGTSWTYRSSGSEAGVNWLEMGTLNGVGGNAHAGSLSVRDAGGRPEAYGSVFDWTCPEGELPPTGGHGDEPGHGPGGPETNCVLESSRFIYGEAVTFTIDRKLNTARLTGTLNVTDHDTGSGGRPPADITWTGIGATSSSTYYSKYTDGEGTTWQVKESRTDRAAQVTGFIGAMGFTDDADDQSDARMSHFKIYERGSSK